MKPFVTASAGRGIAACCLALTCWLVAGPAQSQTTESQATWAMKAPLLAPRVDSGIALLNGKIYVLGGAIMGKTDSQLNQEYDPATDRWRDRAPIPLGATHPGVAGDNGKIYVIGGFTASVHAAALDKVFQYDIATDAWRELPAINSPRGSVGVAIVNGKVHAIGGRISNHVTDNSKATQGARGLPYDMETNGPNTSLHDVYDPATNSWQSAAPLPTARSNGAAVYYHGLILYAGGECKKPNPNGGGDTFFENEAYDPKTNRWLTLAPLPAGRQGFGAEAVGQYAYFAGGSLGCGGGPLTDQLLAFRLP